jgi:hypothetical protein
VSWTGLCTAHCGACHRTFSGIRLFDRHRTVAGGCLDPATLRERNGEAMCELRDGVWRGPEMDAETRLQLFGTAKDPNG